MKFWIVIIADFQISDYARWNHLKSFELQAPQLFGFLAYLRLQIKILLWNMNLLIKYSSMKNNFIGEKVEKL